ncbi:hypothetical protein KKC45_01145 [Patescibacteria group bacterium]|nr:hypothetical protein [Patescibacteria group bacterium]
MKTLKLIGNAFYDLIIRLLPQFKKKEGFAFLVHPRDTKDVIRKYPFLKKLSKKTIEKILRYFWPVTVSEIYGVKSKKTGKYIKGWTISCPLTAEQMLEDRELAKKFIIKTAKLAERKGASLLGLGALTASLTRGGLDIADHTNCKITTGKLFTAKIVTDTLINISNELNLDKKNVLVSVVGAVGSIGSASAQILAKKGYNKINLIDLSDKKEKIKKLSSLLKKINPEMETIESTDLNLLINSDLIIAATNRPEALIRSENLKPGAVVVDDAQPTDVDMEVVSSRKDILILEGGAANSPIINPNFKFGLRNKGDIFSCLAEVIILSYSEMETMYKIGEVEEVNFETLDKLASLAEELNLTTAKFQNSIKTYSLEEINFVKNKLQ